MVRTWLRLGALLALCLCVFAAAVARADAAVTPIGRIAMAISALTCGQEVGPDEAPFCDYKPTVSVELEHSAWVAACDAEGYTPLQGVIEGGQVYTAYVTLIAKPGYCFNADSRVMVYDAAAMGYEAVEPLLVEDDRLVIACGVTAEHEWDYDASTETSATCVSVGREHRVCGADPSHVLDITSPVEPSAHEWGEWETVRGDPFPGGGAAARLRAVRRGGGGGDREDEAALCRCVRAGHLLDHVGDRGVALGAGRAVRRCGIGTAGHRVRVA